MNKQRFIEELLKLNIEISEEQLKQLDKYYKLLVEWNSFMNLTGITAENEVYLKHFYDSLTITKIVNLSKTKTLCDVGTGAGFPGLVLKIIFPHLKITLIDSLNKRINFLNEVIKQLGLKDIETIHTRIEVFGINNREKYDVVVARAVAKLNVLLEYCIPITKIDGYFIAMKANCEEELKEISHALKVLNANFIEREIIYLPCEQSLRTLIKIKKIKETDNKYPRKNSEIKKRTL